jgi:hypothetical protein
MDDYDQAVRAELAEDGSLFDGYHPRMAAVHDANAARLGEIIREHGWPTEALVGVDGASARGEVPRSHFAYIDDRIRVYEGKLQRFGTQWRGGPHGIEPHQVEDAEHVDERRAALGLPSLAQLRATAPKERTWDAEAARRHEEIELEWRRSVGWIS